MTSLRTMEGWVVVHTTGVDYEAEMVLDRLVSQEIEAVIMSKKDHSFNTSFGDDGWVYVLVPPDQKDRALKVLDAEFTDDELSKLAMSAEDKVEGSDVSDEEE